MELLGLVEDVAADLVLLDIAMPGPSFVDLIHSLRESHPSLPVLVLTAQPEDQFAVRSLRAGASGFLGKAGLAQELAEAIRHTANGQKYVSATVAESLVEALIGASDRPAQDSLSERELEVLKLSALGKPVKAIARELALSPKTVSTYRRRILDKLGLHSQAEAIRYAITHGIVGTEQSFGEGLLTRDGP